MTRALNELEHFFVLVLVAILCGVFIVLLFMGLGWVFIWVVESLT